MELSELGTSDHWTHLAFVRASEPVFDSNLLAAYRVHHGSPASSEEAPGASAHQLMRSKRSAFPYVFPGLSRTRHEAQ